MKITRIEIRESHGIVRFNIEQYKIMEELQYENERIINEY